MTANLMEAVSGLISPDLVQKAAGASGESPEGTRSALLGAIPTLFSGLAQGASSPSGAAGVFGLVTRAALKPKEAGGQALLTSVFGNRAEGATEALASHAGVRPAAAGGILALIGPLALGAIGKEVASRGLSAGGLTDLLFSHKKAILDNPNTPKGLASALGVGSLAELGGPAADVSGPTVSAVETAAPRVERTERVREEIPAVHKPKSKWPIMLLPALLLGVLALWGLSNMFKGRPDRPEGDSPTLRQGPGVQERQGPAAEPQMNYPKAPETAAPEIAHPETASAPLPGALPDAKLHFETATTTLTQGSKAGIDELTSYLKDNPDSVIHVEGFADSTGNAAANETLSSNRADAIKNALVARGIDGNRIETSGMGQDNPVAPNDNGHDRAQNRRAEVTLVH